MQDNDVEQIKKLFEGAVIGMHSEQRSTSAWERHAQTVAVMMVMVGILWVGNSIQNLGLGQAENNTKVSLLELQVSKLNDNVKQNGLKYITRLEYDSSSNNYKYILSEYRKRIAALESKVDKSSR